MAALSPILRSVQGGGLSFFCPGCQETHMVMVGNGPGPRWEYNGNPEAPTFKPSILVATGHYVSHWKEGDGCWCKAPDPEDRWPICLRCHSFVTDGQIQFLGDCTHALAGQTVPLPPFEAN